MITKKSKKHYFYNSKLRKLGPYDSVEEMAIDIAGEVRKLEDELDKQHPDETGTQGD